MCRPGAFFLEATMSYITLAFDYTVNGIVKWAANIAHEASDELRQLLGDGVDGIEHEATSVAEAAPEVTPEVTPEA